MQDQKLCRFGAKGTVYLEQLGEAEDKDKGADTKTSGRTFGEDDLVY